jgi:hypothetical protein
LQNIQINKFTYFLPVDNQSGKGLAINVLGNNNERPLSLKQGFRQEGGKQSQRSKVQTSVGDAQVFWPAIY